MTDDWTDDTELESYDDGEGLYDDVEAYDDESRASQRRRRERATRYARLQQRAKARRQAQGSGASARPVGQQTASAVADLDVESKVQRDEFRSALAAVNKRAAFAGWASVGSALVEGGLRAFGTPDNKFVEAGVRAAPLAVLYAGTPRGSGVGGFLASPPTVGIAGLLGLAFLGDRREGNAAVARVDVLGPDTLVQGRTDFFLADVLDRSGKTLGTAPTWKSDKTSVAEIGETTGEVTATGPGVTIIHAIVDGIDRKFRLEVVADPGYGAPGVVKAK